MYVYLSKILPLFVMPIGVTLFLGLAALILLRKEKVRTASVLILVSVVYLWVMATPIVGEGLYAG